MQRHLIGPFFRLFVVLILSTVFVIEKIYLDVRNRPVSASVDLTSEKPRTRFSAAFGQSALAVIGLGALISNELRSQDFDPQYTKTIIERAAKFGGTYYQNGIHNKGPLETAFYDSARIFTSQNSYWFGISFYVLAISLILSLAVASVARMVGSSKTVAFGAAVLVFLHFSISSSDYAGVIYSRNMTTCVLAVVFAAFMTSGVTSIKMLGFGVSLAVLLDATLIRALLVPALMRLFGETNWWAPKPLRRFTMTH